MAVGEDLRRLKGDVQKDKQKNKRPALRDSPRRRDKGAEKSPVKKARKSRSRSKKDRQKERPVGSKEKVWFGKKLSMGGLLDPGAEGQARDVPEATQGRHQPAKTKRGCSESCGQLQRPWATLPAGKAKPQQTFSGRG